uniref:Homeobox domain-containing protein n=1 Tax=Caenorhabditis japonica TaxID=281687 RepID=A0A8R1HK97_CAEJA
MHSSLITSLLAINSPEALALCQVLQGTLPVSFVKDLIANVLHRTDPFGGLCKIVLSVMDGRLVDVIRVCGNFEFAGAQKEIAEVLAVHASSVLTTRGYLLTVADLPPKRSTHLPSYVLTVLKQIYASHHGRIPTDLAERVADAYKVDKRRVINYFKNRRQRQRQKM